jgi:penicillin-binding protein 1C
MKVATTRRKIAAVALLLIAGACLTLTALVFWPVATPEFARVKSGYEPSDAYLLDRHGTVLDSQRINFDVRRLGWVAVEDVSPALVAAIIDGEDRQFWIHRGVDWVSVLGALRDQGLHHRRRGASTISMQLASLLQGRSRDGNPLQQLSGKISQARLAINLERHWTKEQILEGYLNLLTYRGDQQGVAAAVDRLAGKTPASLTLPESLVMAALLPSPSADITRVVARSCARAAARHVPISCEIIRQTAESLLAGSHLAPVDHLAPQLARSLLRIPGQRLQTTLDADLQRHARATLRDQLSRLASKNVRDGAALIVDNESGEVLAYVGSAGSASHALEVDGVRAQRQAGSTLKPFLYELALERRYLTAASLLEDSPLNLDTASGVYIPQDYDHDFKGLVSVRSALAGSLNVPAVRTLVLVGVEAFRNRLHELGYEGITQGGDYYGYSLALGSAEVTLWEQAQAYRTLARGGAFSALRLLPKHEAAAKASLPDGSLPTASFPLPTASFPLPTASPDHQVLPEDASFIVADILSDRGARALTFGLDNHLNTPFWSAAKTGTSKDMRDNWCIGFSSRYTVAVWVGNFEGDAMHDVSGVTGAAPVWHELITAAQESSDSIEPTPPVGVTEASIRFAPSVGRDPVEGDPVEPARREWFLSGAALENTIAASGRGSVARLENPANGMIIALDPDVPLENQRVPISVRGARARMTLKLNDHPLGTATTLQLWTPRPGSYRLTLEDADGRVVDRILFTVRGF